MASWIQKTLLPLPAWKEPITGNPSFPNYEAQRNTHDGEQCQMGSGIAG